MGFWNNVCTYVLALLSQSPGGLYQQDSLTAPSPFFDHDPSLSSHSHLDLTSNIDEIYAPEIFNPQIPTTQGVSNVYNSEFITTNKCNSPTDRQVWCNQTSIDTDYEKVVPDTGKTNYITLVLTSGKEFCGDGYCRQGTMLINGTYPGPLIRGSWGDWFEIKVINNLSNCNGTSIHWHGIRQWNTVWEDGVAGVTQCPIAPGHSQTYRWRATQYGTTWYHSHFSLQYADGLAGPLIIDGPTSMDYEEDKGPLMLTDWYHEDAFGLYYQEVLAVPPTPFLDGTPAVLINGQGAFTNVTHNGTKVEFGCKVSTQDPNCQPEWASTYRTNIKPSKAGASPRYYKYRLINMSTMTHFSFWIDGHNFWIVATDFVPIQPKLMNFLNVAIGQRYDIIVEAKAESTLKKKWGGHPNFWIKMRLCDKVCAGDPCPSGTCEFVECRQGILSYDSKSLASPDLNSKKPRAPTTSCTDPDRRQLNPIVQRDLSGEVPKKMNFTNPFEVDRRAGTQNATEVFGRKHGAGKELERRSAADTEENSMKDHYGDHDGPIPPPRFGKPGEENQPHIWDFGSSHTDPEHPNGRYVSFMIDWANATLGLAGKNISSDTWNPRFVPIVLDKEDKWAVFAIVANWTQGLNHGVPVGKAVPGAAHPIHLHGHDFVVLAQSSEGFVYGQEYQLDIFNPARRDVVMLPANGYVIIGFKTDNPGTWLMHCHIAWHASSGLALQWVERPDDIPALMEKDPKVLPEFEKRCQKWRDHERKHCEWKKGFRAEQDDSGI